MDTQAQRWHVHQGKEVLSVQLLGWCVAWYCCHVTQEKSSYHPKRILLGKRVLWLWDWRVLTGFMLIYARLWNTRYDCVILRCPTCDIEWAGLYKGNSGTWEASLRWQSREKKEEGIYCCEEMQRSWRKKDTGCVGALRLECQDSIYNLVYSQIVVTWRGSMVGNGPPSLGCVKLCDLFACEGLPFDSYKLYVSTLSPSIAQHSTGIVPFPSSDGALL